MESSRVLRGTKRTLFGAGHRSSCVISSANGEEVENEKPGLGLICCQREGRHLSLVLSSTVVGQLTERASFRGWNRADGANSWGWGRHGGTDRQPQEPDETEQIWTDLYSRVTQGSSAYVGFQRRGARHKFD